jgi:hypothetical protein
VGAGLEIFVDQEFGGSDGAAGPSTGSAALNGRQAIGGGWERLQTFDQGRKENVGRAGVWVGQKLKQKATHSAPAAPALEIPTDPEFAGRGGAGYGGGRVGSEGGAPALRSFLDRSGRGPLEDDLLSDPLRLHRVRVRASPAFKL